MPRGNRRVRVRVVERMQTMAASGLVFASDAGRRRPRAPTTPPVAPLAVARRNARERNRVKQVNDGFATLRQHIPASTSDPRAKKLSKVETLRLAVDYIRRLQTLLDEHDGVKREPEADVDLDLDLDDDDDDTRSDASQGCHYSVDVMGCWWPS